MSLSENDLAAIQRKLPLVMRWTQEDYERYARRQQEQAIRRNQTRDTPSSAQLESPVCDEPVAEAQRAAKNAVGSLGRIKVCITSYRQRLLDPDNFAAKYFIDALRYAGAIPDDREEDIIIETRQVRVKGKIAECTEIELT